MQHINAEHLEIRQDTKAERFYSHVKDSDDAYLEYTLHTDRKQNVVEFTDIFVPETIRHIGLAEQMTHKGLEFADKNNFKIQVSCPFVGSYLAKHPEYQHLQINKR